MAVNLSGKPLLIDFVYDYYHKNFGVTSISEKKLIIFLTSLQKNIHHHRVHLFAQFIGLLPESYFLQEEFIFYLKAFNLILDSNLHKEKKKLVLKHTEKSGQLLLKNLKMKKFLSFFEKSLLSKEQRILKKKLEAEFVIIRKNRFFSLDNIIKLSIETLRILKNTQIPLYVEIFHMFKSHNDTIYICILKLICKYFMNLELKTICLFDPKENEKTISFDEYKQLIVSAVTSYNNIGKVPDSTNQIFSIKKTKQSFNNFNFNQIESSKNNVTSKDTLVNQINDPFEFFFNKEKIQRAKLNSSIFELKNYFQSNFPELKSEIIKIYKKAKANKTLIKNHVGYLISKVLENFDDYTFENVNHYFVCIYVIKKELYSIVSSMR